MATGPNPHGRSRTMAATMLFGEFLLLTWLGVSIIGDSAGRSALTAAVLTVLTVAGVVWEQRRRRSLDA